jgi:glutaminyl-peptide cyclotransferase
MPLRHAVLALSIALCLPALAGAQSLRPVQPAVVATYPHDPGAFTQGLFVHEGELYESTGLIGASSLRHIDLESGNVERIVPIDPPHFGEGATRVGDRIFMLTWVSGTGFVFDADSFEPAGRFSYEGEGWGLTWDGNHLVMSDGSARLRLIDPDDFTLSGTIDVTLNGRPVRRLNELEWVDGEIWANIWQTRMIVRIDPQNGQVTGLIDLSSLVPAALNGDPEAVANGIAWNAQTGQIFVTGKLWPVLYEIRLPDENG